MSAVVSRTAARTTFLAETSAGNGAVRMVDSVVGVEVQPVTPTPRRVQDSSANATASLPLTSLARVAALRVAARATVRLLMALVAALVVVGLVTVGLVAGLLLQQGGCLLEP